MRGFTLASSIRTAPGADGTRIQRAFRHIAAGAVLALLGSSALAAQAPGPAEGALVVTPAFSYFDFDGDRGLKGRIVPGVGIGKQLSDRVLLEGFVSSGDADLDPGMGEADITQFRVDVLYDLFQGEGWQPFLVAGMGVIDFDGPDGVRQLDGTDPQLNVGLGVRRWLTDALAVRGDVRSFLSTGDSEIDLASTVGLAFSLGGRRAPPPDSDGDGVYDISDQCPGTQPGVSVDSTGCPLDSDGDGVPDYVDDCPNTPPGAQVNRRGCALDSDGDGVADARDACPNTPPRTPVDDRGCPEVTEPVVFNLYLEFDTNSATIRTSSYSYMEDVVAFLLDYPNADVMLEGHTDSVGDAEYNQRLSKARADSVRDYLVGEGIDGDRISTVGYGETRPRDTNDTAEGRQRNRRVSAVITGEN
jgi:OOP family OmpA-OmpF porin